MLIAHWNAVIDRWLNSSGTAFGSIRIVCLGPVYYLLRNYLFLEFSLITFWRHLFLTDKKSRGFNFDCMYFFLYVCYEISVRIMNWFWWSFSVFIRLLLKLNKMLTIQFFWDHLYNCRCCFSSNRCLAGVWISCQPTRLWCLTLALFAYIYIIIHVVWWL